MAEQWLDEEVVRPRGVDVLLLQQYTALPAGGRSNEFHSLAIDLTQPEEAVLAGINATVRSHIRRAEKRDGIQCVHEPEITDAVIEEFGTFYDDFAAGKALPPLARDEFLGRARAGSLVLSRALRQGRTLVWHAHVVAGGQASMLHSSSLFRGVADKDEQAVIGRANKLLHWKDMLHFKQHGLRIYDFGGWYAGTEDQALLGINTFKERFGGRKVHQRNGAVPLSVKGWLYLALRHSMSARRRKVIGNRLRRLLG